MGTESDGFRTQDLDANTEFRHSAAFSRAVSAVRPFEGREGMEGEHTPETDLIRRLQDLEEGERFESSDLRLERCCFLALLRVDTHLFRALWKELRLPSVGFAFHEAKASCIRTTASPQASLNHALRRAGQLKTRVDKSVHEGEQVSFKEFPG